MILGALIVGVFNLPPPPQPPPPPYVQTYVPYSIDTISLQLGDRIPKVKETYEYLSFIEYGLKESHDNQCRGLEQYWDDIPYYPKGNPKTSSSLLFLDSVLIYHKYNSYYDSLLLKEGLVINIAGTEFIIDLEKGERTEVLCKQGNPYYCQIDIRESGAFTFTIYLQEHLNLIEYCDFEDRDFPHLPRTNKEIKDSLVLLKNKLEVEKAMERYLKE